MLTNSITAISKAVKRHKWKVIIGVSLMGISYYGYRLYKSISNFYSFTDELKDYASFLTKLDANDPYIYITEMADTFSVSQFYLFKDYYTRNFGYGEILEKLKQFKTYSDANKQRLIEELQKNLYVVALSSIFHLNIIMLAYRTAFVLFQRYTNSLEVQKSVNEKAVANAIPQKEAATVNPRMVTSAMNFTDVFPNVDESLQSEFDRLFQSLSYLLSEKCVAHIAERVCASINIIFKNINPRSKMTYHELASSLSKVFDKTRKQLNLEPLAETGFDNTASTKTIDPSQDTDFSIETSSKASINFASFVFDGSSGRSSFPSASVSALTAELYDFVESPHFLNALHSCLEECLIYVVESIHQKISCNSKSSDKSTERLAFRNHRAFDSGGISSSSVLNGEFWDETFVFAQSLSEVALIYDEIYNKCRSENTIARIFSESALVQAYSRMVASPDLKYWSLLQNRTS